MYDFLLFLYKLYDSLNCKLNFFFVFYLGNPDHTQRDFYQNSGNNNFRYSCTLCPYSTPDKYKLVRHNVVHTREQPFVCGVCLRRFTQKENLKRHLVKIHGENV